MDAAAEHDLTIGALPTQKHSSRQQMNILTSNLARCMFFGQFLPNSHIFLPAQVYYLLKFNRTRWNVLYNNEPAKILRFNHPSIVSDPPK